MKTANINDNKKHLTTKQETFNNDLQSYQDSIKNLEKTIQAFKVCKEMYKNAIGDFENEQANLHYLKSDQLFEIALK